MTDPISISVTGVILAGGRARRMGGQDKGLLPLLGRPMIEYVLDALAPEADRVLINANRNEEIYARYGVPVIPDLVPDYAGPLAGIAAAMAAADTDYVLSVPCDGPVLPGGLVSRLAEALIRHRADIATVHDGTRLQPVYALLSRGLLSSLDAYLENEGRKIDRWYQQHQLTIVDFSDQPDAFANINTSDELLAAETRLAEALSSKGDL